jgi:hypothetical protein
MRNVLVALTVGALVVLGGCSDRPGPSPTASPAAQAAQRSVSPSAAPLPTTTATPPTPPSQGPLTTRLPVPRAETPTPAPPRVGPQEANPKLGIGSLRRGSQGEAVESLQRDLNAVMGCGWLVVDGDFGPVTEAAVRVFQQTFGLVVDGVYGPQSAAMMTLLRHGVPDCS